MTYKKLTQFVLGTLNGSEMKPSTTSLYRKMNQNYIFPAFGNREIATIHRKDVKALMDNLSRKKNKNGKYLSSNTLHLILASVSRIFSYAVDENLLEENPCRMVKMRKREAPKVLTFTPFDQKRIIDYIFTRCLEQKDAVGDKAKRKRENQIRYNEKRKEQRKQIRNKREELKQLFRKKHESIQQKILFWKEKKNNEPSPARKAYCDTMINEYRNQIKEQRDQEKAMLKNVKNLEGVKKSEKMKKVRKDEDYYGYLPIAFCLETGLRIGEVLALTWSDYDPKNHVIQVVSTLERHEDENGKMVWSIGNPKTESSNRLVYLTSNAENILSLLDRKCVYIFGKNDHPYSERTLELRLDRLLKKLKMRHLNYHCTRHSYATRLLENGTDVKTVSSLLGHEDASITLKFYAGTSDKSKKRATDAYSKLTEWKKK